MGDVEVLVQISPRKRKSRFESGSLHQPLAGSIMFLWHPGKTGAGRRVTAARFYIEAWGNRCSLSRFNSERLAALRRPRGRRSVCPGV